MKTVRLSILVACLCYFVLATGCDHKPKITENKIAYDSIQVNESYYINNDTTKPGCRIQIHFIYPDSATNNLQTLFTEKMYGSLFKEMAPLQATNEYVKQYKESFTQFITSLSQEAEYENNDYIYEDETGYSYYIQLTDRIVYNQNNFISFTIESISYEGGAHNSRNIHGYVYNLNTHQLLEESDFAGNNYAKNIAPLLAEKLAEANHLDHIKELENIGYNSLDDIKPNNNFTLDKEGITYYFNENEIAGTMIGISRIFIPYEELKIYIQQDSPIAVLASY